MITSIASETFGSGTDKIWKIITDNSDYAWRSDLSKIEVLEDKDTFIEYTKDGYETQFEVTLRIPHQRYEMKFENGNMSGRFVGELSKRNSRTVVTLTEEIEVKKPLMKLFAKGYLKKQQKKYIEDLRRALKE